MIQLHNRRNLRAQVAGRLFDALLLGELQPGERIIETKLARQLGVGQSTLREALQELEHRGLLSKHENRGTFVATLTERQVKEIYSVRLELEPMAAALACQRMTPDHSSELLNLLSKMETATEQKDFVELMKSDFRFHQLIWKLSDNATLERALDLVCAPLFAFYVVRSSHFKHAPARTFGDFVTDQKEHCSLLAALRRGNPEDAKRVFRETLEIFCARHLRHVLEAGEPGIRSPYESQAYRTQKSASEQPAGTSRRPVSNEGNVQPEQVVSPPTE
jgi:DNA-binding GntR family transcriptional regulator